MSMKANAVNIRELRMAMGFTQEKLAEAAKLGHRTVQRIEEGELVRPATLRAIADVLGVQVSDIATASAAMGPSLVEVHRAITRRLKTMTAAGGRNADLKPSIHVLEIAPHEDDEARESPIVVAVEQYLKELGYQTTQGSWDETRLLAKRPRPGIDELFIIHDAKSLAVALQLERSLVAMSLGLAVVVLPTTRVAKLSSRITASGILGRHNALVAYRAA